MPFRDRDWEDFQRDCDVFPAYTDYVFGVDARPEVDDEPGLHPQIFDPQPLLQPPPQRLYGLPQVQFPVAYDLVRDAPQPRNYAMSTLQRASIPRQESSMDSLQPTPCPTPRPLPTAGVAEKLLRPNELAMDPAYSFIPHQQRMTANLNIIQAWSIVHSDAIPTQKAQAIDYIKNKSRGVTEDRQECEALQAVRLQAEMRIEQETAAYVRADHAEAQVDREAEDWHQRHSTPASYAQDTMADPRPAPAYAIHDLSQLPAYVQSHLPQLWTCADTIALQGPPTDHAQATRYQQAQHYYTSFRRSVPPQGLTWVGLVVDGMIGLCEQGGDPMTVLQGMPSVASTL